MINSVIVCVDDEHTILDSLKIELKRALSNTHLIEVAEDGEEALDLIKELMEDNYEIPLVISDYIMPNMRGDELLVKIHALLPDTLKVMLTGQADIRAVENAIAHAKLYRYISKPWQSEDLRLTVKEAVSSYYKNKQLLEQNAQLYQMNQALEKSNVEQKELIAQLHANEKRLMQFLNAMPVGVFIVDSQGKPYYINPIAQSILGEKSISNIQSEEFPDVHQVYVANTETIYPVEQRPLIQALKGNSTHVDNMEIRRKNKTIPIEVWGTPIFDENQKVAYGIVSIQDITERRQAEEEHVKFAYEIFHLNKAYERFIPSEFLKLLDKKSVIEINLGDQVEKEMTILFSDIRGFTSLSETLTPQDNFEFLNIYLGQMEPAIAEHHGFIDKYVGDAIMALFPQKPDDAVRSAVAMLIKLKRYNQLLDTAGFAPIKIGIGINTGVLMLGTLGGQNRMDGTVISDAVNIAARVEELTKVYGTALLITESTYKKLEDISEYRIRVIDQVRVKGKMESVTVYEVFDGDDSQSLELKQKTVKDFEQGFWLYHQKEYIQAKKLFDKVLEINQEDRAAFVYSKRCRAHSSFSDSFYPW
jgi:adenylate cyclase